MGDMDVEDAGVIETDCPGSECRQRFRAARLVPTISLGERLGKLYCPYCGRTMLMNPHFLWVGLPAEPSEVKASGNGFTSASSSGMTTEATSSSGAQSGMDSSSSSTSGGLR